MTEKILTTQRLINPWHFLWLSVVFSELFTASLNTLQGFIWYGKLSPNLLIIGAIDAMFVPLIVALIVIYFMKYTAELKKFNEQLQQEIMQRKRAEVSRQESEAQYRALFEGSPDAILLADPKTETILDSTGREPAPSASPRKNHRPPSIRNPSSAKGSILPEDLYSVCRRNERTGGLTSY